MVDSSKVAGLAKWLCQLQNVKELNRTLGILGYQQPFIKGYAELVKLLTNLTKKGVTFHWTEEHAKALDYLIWMVTSALVVTT